MHANKVIEKQGLIKTWGDRGPCLIERYLATEYEEPEMPVHIWSCEYKNFGILATSSLRVFFEWKG